MAGPDGTESAPHRRESFLHRRIHSEPTGSDCWRRTGALCPAVIGNCHHGKCR